MNTTNINPIVKKRNFFNRNTKRRQSNNEINLTDEQNQYKFNNQNKNFFKRNTTKKK